MSGTTGGTKMKLLREYLAADPTLKARELVRKMLVDHGITIHTTSADRARKELPAKYRGRGGRKQKATELPPYPSSRLHEVEKNGKVRDDSGKRHAAILQQFMKASEPESMVDVAASIKEAVKHLGVDQVKRLADLFA